VSTLSGTVTGGGTGIAGAIVVAHYVGIGPVAPPVSVVTDALGVYAMTLAAPGTYTLFVQPNTPAYPDQWFGGQLAPTRIVFTTDTVQDIALVALGLPAWMRIASVPVGLSVLDVPEIVR
jgi:hypothetical protein